MQHIRDEIRRESNAMRALVYEVDADGAIVVGADGKPVHAGEWTEDKEKAFAEHERNVAGLQRRLASWEQALAAAERRESEAAAVARSADRQGVSEDEALHGIDGFLAGLGAVAAGAHRAKDARGGGLADHVERAFGEAGLDRARFYGAYTAGTDADGGFTVPVEVAEFVQGEGEMIGGFERHVRHLNSMSAGTFRLPTEDRTGLKAAGQAEDESGETTNNFAGVAIRDPAIGQKTFTTSRLRTDIDMLTEELVASTATADLGGYIVRSKLDELMRARATLFMAGRETLANKADISANNRGVLEDAKPFNLGAAKASPDYSQFVDLAYAASGIGKGYLARMPRWFASPSMFGALRKLRDGATGATGRPLFLPQAGTATAPTPAMLFDWPIEMEGEMADVGGTAAAVVLFCVPELYVVRHFRRPTVQILANDTWWQMADAVGYSAIEKLACRWTGVSTDGAVKAMSNTA